MIGGGGIPSPWFLDVIAGRFAEKCVRDVQTGLCQVPHKITADKRHESDDATADGDDAAADGYVPYQEYTLHSESHSKLDMVSNIFCSRRNRVRSPAASGAPWRSSRCCPASRPGGRSRSGAPFVVPRLDQGSESRNCRKSLFSQKRVGANNSIFTIQNSISTFLDPNQAKFAIFLDFSQFL